MSACIDASMRVSAAWRGVVVGVFNSLASVALAAALSVGSGLKSGRILISPLIVLLNYEASITTEIKKCNPVLYLFFIQCNAALRWAPLEIVIPSHALRLHKMFGRSEERRVG